MKRLLPAFGAVAIGAIGGLAASLLLVRGPLAEPPPSAPVAAPTTTLPAAVVDTEASLPVGARHIAPTTTLPAAVVDTTTTSATTLVAAPATRPPAAIPLSERSRLLETANAALKANHSDWNEGRCAAWPIQAADIDFCSYAIWTAMNRTADAIDKLEEHLARFPDDEIVRERISALQTQSNLHLTLLDRLRE